MLNMTSLKLDPRNIPKYCPHCQMNGIKSKVKKFRLEPTEPRVIMCINDKVRAEYFMKYPVLLDTARIFLTGLFWA